jgi:predicted FMN-binding regulatory protein PaiB
LVSERRSRRLIQKQLGSITGLIVSIDRIEAKAKLSQNRTDADRVAVQEKIGSGNSEAEIANYMAKFSADS